jgi:hypothetical protein
MEDEVKTLRAIRRLLEQKADGVDITRNGNEDLSRAPTTALL